MNPIIAGALSGAGNGLATFGQMQLQASQQSDLMGQRANLEEQKAKSLIDYQNNLAQTNKAKDETDLADFAKTNPSMTADDALKAGHMDYAKYLSDKDNKAQLLDIKEQSAKSMADLALTRGQLNDAMSAYREAQANNLDRKALADQEKQNKELQTIYGRQGDTLSSILKSATETGTPDQVKQAQGNLDAFNQRISAVISTAQDTKMSPAQVDTIFNGIKSGRTSVHAADGRLYADAGNGKVFEIPGAIAAQMNLDAGGKPAPDNTAPSNNGPAKTVGKPIIYGARSQHPATLFGSGSDALSGAGQSVGDALINSPGQGQRGRVPQ